MTHPSRYGSGHMISSPEKPERSAVRGRWSVVTGLWCVVRGAWCVVRGAWCVVRGAWCVVRCARRVSGDERNGLN